MAEGKKAAKEALQKKLGLKISDLPLVGIITRLTHQKGIQLIKHAIWRTIERNGQVIFFLSSFVFPKCFGNLLVIVILQILYLLLNCMSLSSLFRR